MTPHEGDLDLVALHADGVGGCDPGSCIGTSQNTGATQEEIVIPDAAAGTDYYFIVDGYSGAISAYTLEVICERR